MDFLRCTRCGKHLKWNQWQNVVDEQGRLKVVCDDQHSCGTLTPAPPVWQPTPVKSLSIEHFRHHPKPYCKRRGELR